MNATNEVNEIVIVVQGMEKEKVKMESKFYNLDVEDDIDQLKASQTELEQFINVVVDDLKSKMDKLEQFKSSERCHNVPERNYINLQMFMIDKYRSRIEHFRTLSRVNVENIVQEFNINKSHHNKESLKKVGKRNTGNAIKV